MSEFSMNQKIEYFLANFHINYKYQKRHKNPWKKKLIVRCFDWYQYIDLKIFYCSN